MELDLITLHPAALPVSLSLFPSDKRQETFAFVVCIQLVTTDLPFQPPIK
jgi:hypothetical protein